MEILCLAPFFRIYYEKKVVLTMSLECNGVVHVIEKGDTLYKLSRMYGVKLIDIMRENPFVNVYNLQVGDEICIPVMEDDMRDYYLVEAGKTFADVLKELNTDIGSLFAVNKELYNMRVPRGMVLRIPEGANRPD